ncbi:ABC transporter ATP-binding protein [Desulfuromonas sp. TF]|uniref:ABC transporter ATP-binding protein n=1 Tax=Desulfuromonas sp. TF TaxID=1232410 RepID=UPI000411DB92|nr:ABC transporter ATP-binding protein [Desulfuromonas sp. TF]
MIEVKDLKKGFASGRGRVEVLDGIDLIIRENERVAVVGASGAGKTTLMHIIGGLDHPTSGTVLFEGKDIFTLKGAALDAFRNRTIGFVFQFHQLLPEFSALENVMMPALIARQDQKEAAEKAESLLEEVGLGHRLTHKPGELSGGEQQRVAIARALVMSPRLLLADEPTGNLDSGTSDEIYRLLHQLHQTRGLTMVIVTHSETLAKRLDRIVHMADGRFLD